MVRKSVTPGFTSSGTSHGRIAAVVLPTLSFGYARQHEEHHAHGRMQQPIIRFSTITSPKWTGLMLSLEHNRKQYRYQNGDGGGGFQEAATNSISTLASSRNSQGSLVNASTSRRWRP